MLLKAEAFNSNHSCLETHGVLLFVLSGACVHVP